MKCIPTLDGWRGIAIAMVLLTELCRALLPGRDTRLGKGKYRHDLGEKPEERAAPDRMLSLRVLRHNSTRSAAKLNPDDYNTRSGRPWRSTTVAKMLAWERAGVAKGPRNAQRLNNLVVE